MFISSHQSYSPPFVGKLRVIRGVRETRRKNLLCIAPAQRSLYIGLTFINYNKYIFTGCSIKR